MKFNTSKFVWGEVLKVHQIGNYKIIEYHPYIYEILLFLWCSISDD